jgi:hypothetical protein
VLVKFTLEWDWKRGLSHIKMAVERTFSGEQTKHMHVYLLLQISTFKAGEWLLFIPKSPHHKVMAFNSVIIQAIFT